MIRIITTEGVEQDFPATGWKYDAAATDIMLTRDDEVMTIFPTGSWRQVVDLRMTGEAPVEINTPEVRARISELVHDHMAGIKGAVDTDATDLTAALFVLMDKASAGALREVSE